MLAEAVLPPRRGGAAGVAVGGADVACDVGAVVMGAVMVDGRGVVMVKSLVRCAVMVGGRLSLVMSIVISPDVGASCVVGMVGRIFDFRSRECG